MAPFDALKEFGERGLLLPEYDLTNLVTPHALLDWVKTQFEGMVDSTKEIHAEDIDALLRALFADINTDGQKITFEFVSTEEVTHHYEVIADGNLQVAFGDRDGDWTMWLEGNTLKYGHEVLKSLSQ